MLRQDWGQVEYTLGVERQLDLLEQVRNGSDDTLVFCTHDPVVTLGRASKSSDILSWSGPLIETSRGGRATYHGPNQVVIYPILDLDRDGRSQLKKRDLHSYLRGLETAIIETLKGYQILAEVKSDSVLDEDGDELLLTGVWVGERKIASLGVAVKRWVTYHGVALNVIQDPLAFQGINPCGFKTSTMISMEKILGESINQAVLKESLYEQFSRAFS